MSRGLDRVRKKLQRSCASCGSKECAGCSSTQRMPRGQAPATVPPTVYRALRAPGSPLDDSRRGEHARALGHDLSAVRIHDDRDAAVAADDMKAHAFTFGQHVVLAADTPDLAGPDGRQLLRHELTHVVQHQSPWNPERESLGVLGMHGTDSAEEREAARAGSLDEQAEVVDEQSPDIAAPAAPEALSPETELGAEPEPEPELGAEPEPEPEPAEPESSEPEPAVPESSVPDPEVLA